MLGEVTVCVEEGIVEVYGDIGGNSLDEDKVKVTQEVVLQSLQCLCGIAEAKYDN